jgi:hypothetical protein
MLLYVDSQLASPYAMSAFVSLRGKIVEYEIDWEMFHTTDSRAQLHFAFVTPSAEGLDKLYAGIRAALSENSLIGPAFGSMMVNFTPQADYVRVNATYK